MTSISIRKIDNIILTHYVNPHHFYFKYKDDKRGDDILSCVNRKVEKYVERHIEKRHSNPYSPDIGEIVLCHYITDCINKWIRARVDTKLKYNKEKFILWAIDYGFPIETESRWIRPILFEDLKVVEKGLIFKGGIFDIVPSTVEWNFIQSVEDTRKTKKWSTRTVNTVEKYIFDAENVTFRCRAYYEDNFFGSLIIQAHTGTQLIVEEFLKDLKEGVDSSNFLKEFLQLEDPAIPYWQREKEDAIYKIYDNNSDQSMCVDVTNMTSIFTTNDSLFNKNETETDLPMLEGVKDKKIDEKGEMFIKLSDQLETATKLSLRRIKNSSKSRGIPITSANEQPTKSLDVVPKLSTMNDNQTIHAIPMNKRLKVALQKIEQGKMAARKLSMIDEENKKVMAFAFPAGFIVDNKAIKEKFRGDNDSTEKNNRRYQKAKKDEECFSVDHAQRLLIHDHHNIPLTPITEIHDAYFPQEVHTALKRLNINQIFRIQTIGWPLILTGSSTIVVNNARSGKTMAFLPAICARIIEQIEDGNVVDGCGPLSIIACASSQVVKETTQCIEDLLRFTNNGIKCFKAHGFGDQTNVMCQLLNGSEILVTTVPRLYRLMKNDMNFFSKERIISLVFDNIDLVYGQFGREICEIHKSLCGPMSDVQMIVTSRIWFKLLEKFYIESDRVILCIGSYLEAAVYGKTAMTLELLNHKLKMEKLIAHINGINYRLELTLVICNTPEDVKDILKELQSTSIKSWSYHDKSDSSEIAKIEKRINEKQSGDFRLLICSDEVLRDLNIRRAQHIIHYALPSTWTMFNFRFSVLFDHHENLLERKSDYKPATSSVVFVDENNNEELPRLIDFMKTRLNGEIPEKVLELAEFKRIENEQSRANCYKQFCSDLLSIGVCQGRLTCNYRHILTKFDRSRNEIPQNGYVKLEIIRVHSPVHFTVRLLEHRLPSEKKWTKLSSAGDIFSFNMEMTNYFGVEENHVTHFPVMLGDLCIYCSELEGGKYYERGKIVKIEEKESWSSGLKQYWVEILLVDTNERKSCLSNELKQLPDRFKSFPHQAVDVRIVGIRPRDFESEWDSTILELVEEWIRNESPHYCQGLIQLSIMNTLWLDSIDIVEKLNSIGKEVIAVSIKKNLIKRKFCVVDPKPLELMINLAETAGLRNLPKSHDADVLPKDRTCLESTTGQRTKKNSKFRSASRSSSSIDLDESIVSGHNWTTSIDDDDDDPEMPLAENLKHSSACSGQEEDLLRLSKDKWAELTSHQFNKVSLCNFYHPNRIYIRNNYYSSRFMELNKRIAAFMAIEKNLKQLSNVSLAVNCCCKVGNGFGRAKIMKIFRNTGSITAEVFFVDLGDTIILPVDELFELPDRFITPLPFQAIFCKLIGIRPSDSTKWCDDICDEIYGNVLVKQPHFYARSMQLGSPDKYAHGLKCRSYQVVLLDETGNVNINNWIVSNHYGEYDSVTEHLVDIAIDEKLLKQLNSDSSEESDCVESALIDDPYDGVDDHFDFQFTNDEIMKLILGQQTPIACDNQIDSPPAEVTEIFDKETKIPETKKSSVETYKPVADDKSKFIELVSLHKYPKIHWHQTESMVFLSIHAPDVADYFLKVTPRLVNICFTLNRENFTALLNLFGCVDVERTVHEIRGLNIKVRLFKTLKQLSWPRLVQTKEKCQWIQYNLEAVPQEESQEFYSDEKKGDLVVDTMESSDGEGSLDDDEIDMLI